jgi:Domain of unknown function (DUF3472)/Domain of unknown function (DUF5077)
MILATLILAPTLFVPGFTGYSDPDDEGIPIEQNGAGPWKDPKQSLVWIGDLKAGNLSLQIKGGNSGVSYSIQIDNKVERISNSQVAQFNINRSGYRKIVVRAAPGNSSNFGTIQGLQLAGSSLEGARFNLKERRNCASVHLKYPLEPTEKAEWFYNEIRPKTDPKYTYYEACGWHRGYFGIQVNSPTERRIIFSVWDAGDEAVDRNKVGDTNRVKLLKKGEDVVAGDFGNEGTGGHSHMVYNWKTNDVHRFLVHAEPKGDSTTYSGYYYFNDRKEWGLIAKFRAPKDGSFMKGLYSFNENFGGSNGNLQRMAEFGPVFVAGSDGRWKEHLEAQFSCDATGKADRFDYAAGPKGDRWMLSNGGAFANGVKFGDKLSRLNSATRPPKVLPND